MSQRSLSKNLRKPKTRDLLRPKRTGQEGKTVRFIQMLCCNFGLSITPSSDETKSKSIETNDRSIQTNDNLIENNNKSVIESNSKSIVEIKSKNTIEPDNKVNNTNDNKVNNNNDPSMMFSDLVKRTEQLLVISKDVPPPPPTVYQDSIAMMAGALIIYFFADLRDMARAGEISATLEELSPPLTSGEVIAKIQGNEEALAKRAINSEDLRKRLEALEALQEHEAGLFQTFFSAKKKAQVMMTHFVDTKALEEIVHAIVVNTERKRITVIFRGSVTQKDFMQDAKLAQKKMDNPVAWLMEKEEQKLENISIHTGFHEYLFHQNEETGLTRLEEIMGQVKESLEKYPGFTLYTCGHSLGGALCTLFGFFVASNEELSKLLTGPVVVYSIASPYVGNWKFRYSFQQLERQKRIQHLRIANQEDMVTLMPFAAPKLTALSPVVSLVRGAGNLYKHCGMRLQMTGEEVDGAIHTITYPKDHECTDDDEYAKEIQDSMTAGKSLAQAFYYMIRQDFDRLVLYHSCEEYEERLEKCKDSLMNVTLDQLYADKTIVGNILDEDYEPKKMESGMSRAKRALGYFSSSSRKESTKSITSK